MGTCGVCFANFGEGSFSQKPMPNQTSANCSHPCSQIRQLAASAGNQVNSVKTHPPLPISWFGPSGGLMQPWKLCGNMIKPNLLICLVSLTLSRKSGWEVLTNHLGSINHFVFSLPVFDQSLSTYCRRSMVICECLHQQAQG